MQNFETTYNNSNDIDSNKLLRVIEMRYSHGFSKS